jgi:hypothetical protein
VRRDLEVQGAAGGVLSVRYEAWADRRDGGRRDYERFWLACPCAAHGKNCMKRRALGPRQTAQLGPREPQAYLLAWAEEGPSFPARAAHVLHRPTQAAVAEAFQRFALEHL